MWSLHREKTRDRLNSHRRKSSTTGSKVSCNLFTGLQICFTLPFNPLTLSLSSKTHKNIIYHTFMMIMIIEFYSSCQEFRVPPFTHFHIRSYHIRKTIWNKTLLCYFWYILEVCRSRCNINYIYCQSLLSDSIQRTLLDYLREVFFYYERHKFNFLLQKTINNVSHLILVY